MQVARKIHVKTISEFAAILLAAFVLVLIRFMFHLMLVFCLVCVLFGLCFSCTLIIPAIIARDLSCLLL